MTDCAPVAYTAWAMFEDAMAAVGIASSFALVGMSLRWLFEKVMDAAAVDL